MQRGYIQVYTGDGKGKTTAALGLCLRAAGAGLRVYFGQFMKRGETSETRALRAAFPAQVTVAQYGTGRELSGPDAAADGAAARAGFAAAREAVCGGGYDVAVLDEINVALRLGYVQEVDVLALLCAKPSGTELVLTGRYAPQAVQDAADLVTEMREIKHYYAAGVPAREGIEL